MGHTIGLVTSTNTHLRIATWQRMKLPIIAAFLGSVCLLVDILLPLGTADGVLYMAVVLVGWWMPGQKRTVFYLTMASSLLVGVGYFLSPAADIPEWVILVNRGYSLFAIWSVAVIMGIAKTAVAKLEQQVFESSKCFIAIEQSPAAVIITDPQGTIEYINPRFTELTGYTLTDVVGCNPRLLKSGLQDAATYTNMWQEINAHNSWRGELFDKKKSGELYLASVSISGIYDKKGKLRNFVGTQEDITHLRQEEKKLTQANRALRSRYRFSEILATATEEEPTLERLCQILVQEAGYRLAWVGFADEGEEQWVFPVAQYGVDNGYLQTLQISWADCSYGRGPVGTAIRSGQPCIVHNIQQDPSFEIWRERATKWGYSSCIALPLKMSGMTFGALTLYSGQPCDFDETESALLTELANYMADGILHIRENEKYRRTEQAVQVNERRFRALFNTMTSGVAIYDVWNDGEDFIIKEINQAGAKISNIGVRNIIGQRATLAFPGIQKFGLFAVFQQVHRTGETAYHPITWYADDHHQKWLENFVYKLESGEIVAIYNDLTDKKRDEEYLRLAYAALDNTKDMIFWSQPDGHFIWVNRSVIDTLGYSEAELLTMTPSDFNPTYPREVWPAHWAELKKKGIMLFESTLTRKSASPLLVEICANYLQFENKEYNLAIVRDISARKQIEQSVRQYAAIVAASNDHMAFLDRDYIYRAVNNAYLQNHGLQFHEIVGHTVSDLFGAEIFAQIRGHLDQCLSGESVNYQAWFDFSVSGHRWMDICYFPHYQEDGQVTGIVVVSRDNTDRKQMEDALHHSEKQARHANQAKGEFLANMSHEIRTPMNAIIGMSYLALETDLSVQQRGYLEKIHAASNALLRIINDILDFSKIDAGKLELESESFDFYQVLDLVSDNLLAKAQQKSTVEILFSIPIDIPRNLQGDATRLAQVLINLCDNAIKFTEQGEVVVKVVLLDTETDIDQIVLCFSVRDTGIGIPAEQIERILQPFQQADTSITRKYGGTGLGLTICRNLVEMMGGNLMVESQPGQGSQFSFMAYFKPCQQEKQNQVWMLGDLRGKRVLVVDDNATSREILLELLTSLHFSNSAVDSGRAAIDELGRASAAGLPYELVLLDWSMPEMNGIETARQILNDPAIPVVPLIIMISAFHREMVMVHAAEVGITAFIHKPVTPSSLFNAIMKRFDKRLASDTVPSSSPYFCETELCGRRILLVDDLSDNLDLLREILQKRGVVTTLAHNGQKAVEAVTQATIPFDVILMDVQMPVMDGHEATRTLRRLPAMQKLPIIAMTASAIKQDVEACLEAGMNDHLAKPIDIKLLLAKLVQWSGPSSALETQPLELTKLAFNTPMPGIDIADGMSRCEGDAQFFARLVTNFVRESQQATQPIGEAMMQHNMTAALHLAHKLKGAAGNISAMELACVAGQMEAALHHGDHATASALLNPLRTSLDLVLVAGQNYLDQGSQADTKAIAINTNDALILLHNLGVLLEKRDIQCDAYFALIHKNLAGFPKVAQLLTELQIHINHLEIQGAMAVITLLIKKLEEH